MLVPLFPSFSLLFCASMGLMEAGLQCSISLVSEIRSQTNGVVPKYVEFRIRDLYRLATMQV